MGGRCVWESGERGRGATMLLRSAVVAAGGCLRTSRGSLEELLRETGIYVRQPKVAIRNEIEPVSRLVSGPTYATCPNSTNSSGLPRLLRPEANYISQSCPEDTILRPAMTTPISDDIHRRSQYEAQDSLVLESPLPIDRPTCPPSQGPHVRCDTNAERGNAIEGQRRKEGVNPCSWGKNKSGEFLCHSETAEKKKCPSPPRPSPLASYRMLPAVAAG